MRHKSRKRPIAEINVVPYIDVMLVLLVIFMITAPLLTQGIHVHLPKAHSSAIQHSNSTPLVVSVDRLGQYYLNVNSQPQQPINGQQLMTLIAAHIELAKQQHQQLPIYVKGDHAVDYGKVVHAMALIQAAGGKDIGLLTQPAKLR